MIVDLHDIKMARLTLLLVLLVACQPSQPTRTGDGVAATIEFVIDGDTVELKDGRRVRYIGVNTAETGQPYAAEAQALNESLVAGKAVWLEMDEQDRDSYGRVLAYVWIDDLLVNLELVRQGYANSYPVPPNLRYVKSFARAEREAREAGRGQWLPSDSPLRMTALQYDGPGSDRIAPNGEWIELTNTGDAAVDLDGYRLRDAGLHVYTFSAIVVAPGETIRLYSGRGVDTDVALYWGLAGEEVWDNAGDAAYLYDPGAAFVDAYTYTP